MSSLVTGIAFIVLLGGLVFVHELGHFLAAKFFNVKVLKFSLGFGPRIWGFRRGETEYQLAALPLGGFVKMAGEAPGAEVDPADKGRGFAEQAPYKRAIIAFAGPGVNLALPILVYFAMNLAPQMREPAVIGAVIPNEPAQRAGLQSGDRVLSIEGIETPTAEQTREAIESRPGQELSVVVDRGGEQKTIKVKTSIETEKNILETTQKGRVGIQFGKVPAYIGVVPGSRADQAGLKTFDRITAINGKPVTGRGDLQLFLNKDASSELKVDFIRSDAIDLKTASVSTAQPMTLTIPAGATEQLGIDEPGLYLREVLPDSTAYAAGLRAGDKIIALDGTPVASDVRYLAMLGDRKTLNLTVSRGGQNLNISYEAKVSTRADRLYGDVEQIEVGYRRHPLIYAQEPFAANELIRLQYGVGKAMSRAVDQAFETTRIMTKGIAAMVTGKVGMDKVGGPIMMFQLTSMATENGFASFMMLFALISINLGLMNLLPVPVLDGFHIIIASIEGISRRTVPVRAREIAQVVGMVMLLSLMVLAFKNDIWRVFKARNEPEVTAPK